MEPKQTKKSLFVMIPSELHEKIRQHAFDARTSKAEIVREALWKHLKQESGNASDSTQSLP